LPGLTCEPPGAPEVLIDEGSVDQTVDVWSFGCILSIAASWIAFGSYEGVKQYSAYRKQAISTSLSEGVSRDKVEAVGDYFHNGVTVLPEIQKWHAFLRTILRKTDTITSRVLDLIDRYMLVSPHTFRLSSSDLCDELAKISGATLASNTEIDESIVTFLRQQDEQIPEDSSSSLATLMPAVMSYSTYGERQNAKSSIESAPLRPTAHRSERVAASVSRRMQSMINTSIRANASNHNLGSPSRDTSTNPQFSNDKRQSLLSHDSSHSLQPVPSIHDIETVDDVYDSMTQAKARKRGLSLKLRFGYKRVVEPDVYLAKYYRNRDIVSIPSHLHRAKRIC
jgi:hypothetical protein